MTEVIEIKGGAGEFEAAVIAVVLDRITGENKRRSSAASERQIPPWILAVDPKRSRFQFGDVRPR